MKRIVVEDYDPGWVQTFERLRTIYLAVLGDMIVDIQHVGSTSVPGIKAKPIIDIDIVFEDNGQLALIVSRLERLGYRAIGDLCISGRLAFHRASDWVPYTSPGTGWQEHHLYLCERNAISLKNHLLLRDYLLRNPKEAVLYGTLKEELAAQYPYDMTPYVIGKTAFISRVLEKQINHIK